MEMLSPPTTDQEDMNEIPTDTEGMRMKYDKYIRYRKYIYLYMKICVHKYIFEYDYGTPNY
jgi:hypothetical protein